jgi:hypothetical protein
LLPTFILYKPEVIEAKEEDSDQENDDEFLRKNHFYAGKPLRRAPLWAIPGSSGHPFLVSFSLLVS